ncbi:putative membrane protein [Halalkalibacter oceani]
MFEWRNIFKGMTMGISDLIPGVSGGTIALVLGIYQNLLAAINGLFTRQWKKHLMFLLPLGIGIVAALLAVSHLVEWLLAEYPQPTFFFFLGLIIGIIPKLMHDIEFTRTFTAAHYVLLLIGALIVGLTVFVKEDELAPVMTALSTGDYALLFFAGWLASSAMILPGISGSFIFLLFGVYPTVVNALSTINIPVIMTVGAGIAIGLIVTSRFIAWLLRQFKVGTYAVIIGFIVGSIIVIYPGIGTDRFLLLVSVLTFLFGAGCAFLLSRFEQKNQL